MDEKLIMHRLVDSGILQWIGFIAVYLIREFQKDFKYKKIREEQTESFKCRFLMKEERDLDKLVCKFHMEDHARLSDTLFNTKTAEIFLKDIVSTQTEVTHSQNESLRSQHEMVRSLEKIAKGLDDVAKEIRQEIGVLKNHLMTRGKK